MEITIDQKLKDACPALVVGSLTADVKVEKSGGPLVGLLDKQAGRIARDIPLDDIIHVPNIARAREAYKNLGKDPHRYRISSEALYRRICQGKGLYYVNNVVDINNLLSLLSGHSVGSYDLGRIDFPVAFTVGGRGESYEGIGKGAVNIEDMPVLKDERGCFGSPTSDSKRGMITEETGRIMMNFFAFGGEEGLEGFLNCGKDLLLQHAQAKNLQTVIIR